MLSAPAMEHRFRLAVFRRHLHTTNQRNTAAEHSAAVLRRSIGSIMRTSKSIRRLICSRDRNGRESLRRRQLQPACAWQRHADPIADMQGEMPMKTDGTPFQVRTTRPVKKDAMPRMPHENAESDASQASGPRVVLLLVFVVFSLGL